MRQEGGYRSVLTGVYIDADGAVDRRSVADEGRPV